MADAARGPHPMAAVPPLRARTIPVDSGGTSILDSLTVPALRDRPVVLLPPSPTPAADHPIADPLPSPRA